MSFTFVRAFLIATLFVGSVFGQTPSSEQSAEAALVPASAESFAAASQRVIATLRATTQLDGASPALAVVMVRKGEAPIVWVHGRLDARTSRLVDADTPFYVASQTKAFVGLMALKLHARGIFSLDQSLADVWPNLQLPRGADPRAITFRQLLSHQGVIENETLEYRTAYTDRVPARDYQNLLSKYSTIREIGFAYRNIGYLIYGAALEIRTRRDWREWLDAEILRPAGMTRTSARPSRFKSAELPLYHQWLGGSEWKIYRVKDDAVMHAAGGLVISPTDMAHWLALQLGEKPNVAPAALLAQSHAMQIVSERRSDVLTFRGYATGWNVCRIGAADVLEHGGGYIAVRSNMAVSPELGVAFAFMSNSDSLTGRLSEAMTQVFFETIQSSHWDGPTPEALQSEFRTRLTRLLDNRRNTVAQRRAEAQWEGWRWQPMRTELRRYVGRYRNERLGDMHVVLVDDSLRIELGVLHGRLEPAKSGLFGFAETDLSPPTPFAFDDTSGRIDGFTWSGGHFQRVR